MYTNALLSNEKALLCNTCGQIITASFGYLNFVPLEKICDMYLAISILFQEVGVPTVIHSDNSRKMNLIRRKLLCERHGSIKMTTIETHFSMS